MIIPRLQRNSRDFGLGALAQAWLKLLSCVVFQKHFPLAMARFAMRCLLVTAVAAVRVIDDEAALPDSTRKVQYWYANENETITEQLMKDLGCYCKKVSSMKDCPSSKPGSAWSDPARDPANARFFHPDVSPKSEKPHLCCKMAWTAWYDRKGFGYTQQATAERCFVETRPLEDACCRIGKKEQVAVRLKQIKMKAFQDRWKELWYSPTTCEYGKGVPYFSVNDIASATDFDGSALSIQQVKELLQYKVQVGALKGWHKRDKETGETVYFCTRTFEELIADQEDCRARTEGPTESECCCLQATVVPAQRCFPAAGATPQTGPLWVNGSYVEEGGKLKEGKISWPKTPEELDKDLPDLLQSQDPEAVDGLEYDWSRATAQWNTTCKANQKVAWVRKTKKPKRYHSGGRWRTSQTNFKMVYQQEWKTECISMEFNRICPRGQGLYVKQFPLGTCTKVPGPTNSDQLQLVGLGSGVMFQCPDGYQSGTKGAMKSNAHCHCDGC